MTMRKVPHVMLRAERARRAEHSDSTPRRFLLRCLLVFVAAVGFLAPTPGGAFAQSFTGAGSTFAHPIIARWGQVHSSLQGEGGGAVSVDGGLDYEPVGSLGGVLRVLSGGVEFGATDAPLNPAELARHELIQFPIVSGGIAVIVGRGGMPAGQLRLSGPVLARIFLGELRSWSHPAIRELNPDLLLPDAPIAVVHREDGSGTTWNFAAFLGRSSADWMQQVGIDQQLRWPVGTGARSSRELAERVAATPGAIGFVEAGLAARMGLPVVLIQNRAGSFVPPAAANLAEALATMRWDPARHFHAPQSEPEGAGAYPITATVFAVMQRRPASRVRARRAQDFFRMALAERAGDAAALGYVPLPDAAVQQVLAYWRNPAR
jgi:phosphate transport system substrate-binding protein